jgi:hypothetical protein
MFFYVPGLIHAILVIHEKKADKRALRQAELIAKGNRKNQ